MKYTRVLGLGVCAMGLGAGLCVPSVLAADPPSPDVPSALVEEIVAKVNGDIVTRGELEHQKKQLEQELRAEAARQNRIQDIPAILKEREKDLLRDRIDTLLLVQKGKELNINVDPEISKYLANIQAETKIADPEKFQQYLREQTGMSYEDFRNEAKNGMLTQRVIRQEVGGRITIKREDLEKYYNEHKTEFVRDERVFVRGILISTEGRDAAGVAAADKKAKDIVSRARKGEKFADLARDNSDADTAKQGGDMGAFEKGKLRKDIEDQIWDKEKGYVTDPINVGNGFLIVKVEEHQRAGQASFEEVENEIQDKLFMPKMQPAIREYLTGLRQQAFLEIKEGWTDSGAATGKDTRWTDPAQLRPETVTKEEVLSKIRKKRALWMIPVPGTTTAVTGKSRSH